MSDLVGNPEDRFSRVAAQVNDAYVFDLLLCCPCDGKVTRKRVTDKRVKGKKRKRKVTKIKDLNGIRLICTDLKSGMIFMLK